MANPLGRHAAELEALRDLKIGKYRLEPDDPIWEALQELGLVENHAPAAGGLMSSSYPMRLAAAASTAKPS